MVEFEDPITDTEYDASDPLDMAKTAVMVLGGMAVTLTLFAVANNNVVPAITGFIADLTGYNAGGSGDTPDIV